MELKNQTISQINELKKWRNPPNGGFFVVALE